MSQGPAAAYAEITEAVERLARRYSGNDRRRARYMIMRAAALGQRADAGARSAFEMVSDLADEMIYPEGTK